MDPTSPGELVKVAGAGPDLDGIVFDMPSASKTVVAVMDPVRGPLFRTVNPSALTPRSEDGPDDRALRLLIRRTPSPAPGSVRDGVSGGRGRSGYQRGTAHRTTGR